MNSLEIAQGLPNVFNEDSLGSWRVPRWFHTLSSSISRAEAYFDRNVSMQTFYIVLLEQSDCDHETLHTRLH